MFSRLPIACTVFALVLSAATAIRADESERNSWPAWVDEVDDANRVQSWNAVGPLFFARPAPEDGRYAGFRPLYLQRKDAEGVIRESTVLYPLFIHRRNGNTSTWSVFNLINHGGPSPVAPAGIEPKTFDVWPFYFSRDTGAPESSYHALFPIAGTIQNRFGYDCLQWGIFPLYFQSERAGVITTSTPWPFIKRTKGAGQEGFAFWPLFGYRQKPGEFHHRYFLWPLIYKNESRLSEVQPTVQMGFLPFYTKEKSAGVISENYLWPFFGYTDRREPVPYHEVRYFWPFLVQGRGPDRYVNRWGPFYTHSIRKGVDKRWFVWPLVRQQDWNDDDIKRSRSQFLFFLYWSEAQHSLSRPELAPAGKTHLWPLLSIWDNGAGRRQLQFPSPLEVFFPDNDKVRQLYSPLFALYRYDQRSADEVRWSLLWNAVTWRRDPRQREFHFGPLFSSTTTEAGRRIALGNGVIGLQRPAGGGWRMFLFDFSSRTGKPAVSQSR